MDAFVDEKTEMVNERSLLIAATYDGETGFANARSTFIADFGN
jgi:hypothetical protein